MEIPALAGVVRADDEGVRIADGDGSRGIVVTIAEGEMMAEFEVELRLTLLLRLESIDCDDEDDDIV